MTLLRKVPVWWSVRASPGPWRPGPWWRSLLGPAVDAIRAHRWSRLWLGPATAGLVIALALAYRTRAGHTFLMAYAVTRPDDPVGATLIKLPLSMFAPAALLPYWFAVLQVGLVYPLCQAALGTGRTLLVAVSGHGLATLADTVWVALGRPVGVPHTYAHLGDAGPSVAVVTLLAYLVVARGQAWLLAVLLGYDAAELAIFDGLAQRDHLVGTLTGTLAALVIRPAAPDRADRVADAQARPHSEGVRRTPRLYHDPPGLVSTQYSPGGDLAAAVRSARGWATVRVALRFLARLRVAPLCVLGVVALDVVLGLAGGSARDAVVVANSTNVTNLEHHRIWTLVSSAVVTDGRLDPLAVAQLLVVLAVGELLWGWRRLLVVFLAGNVVASCLVYALLRAGLRNNWLPDAVAGAHDVGISYGVQAVSGAIAASLPVRARRVLVPLALLIVVVALVGGRTFTDVGHLLSLLIGLVAGVQMRRRPLARWLPWPAVRRTDRILTYAFPDVAATDRALGRALHLQQQHRVHLHDATVVWPDQARRVHVRHTRDVDAVDGLLAGASWGVVVGTLVGLPVAGLVLGALLTAVAAHMHEVGLSDSVIRRALGAVPPGGALLLLLTRPDSEPALDEAVRPRPVAPAR